LRPRRTPTGPPFSRKQGRRNGVLTRRKKGGCRDPKSELQGASSKQGLLFLVRLSGSFHCIQPHGIQRKRGSSTIKDDSRESQDRAVRGGGAWRCRSAIKTVRPSIIGGPGLPAEKKQREGEIIFRSSEGNGPGGGGTPSPCPLIDTTLTPDEKKKGGQACHWRSPREMLRGPTEDPSEESSNKGGCNRGFLQRGRWGVTSTRSFRKKKQRQNRVKGGSSAKIQSLTCLLAGNFLSNASLRI